MVRLVVEMAEQWAVVEAQLMDHLADARDVVVAAADEADERFPGVLLENADAGEFGCFLGEVGVGKGPLLVQFREVRAEVEIVFDQLGEVLVFGSGNGWRF